MQPLFVVPSPGWLCGQALLRSSQQLHPAARGRSGLFSLLGPWVCVRRSLQGHSCGWKGRLRIEEVCFVLIRIEKPSVAKNTPRSICEPCSALPGVPALWAPAEGRVSSALLLLLRRCC